MAHEYSIHRLLAGALVMAALFRAAGTRAQSATITIQADQPGAIIPLNSNVPNALKLTLLPGPAILRAAKKPGLK